MTCLEVMLSKHMNIYYALSLAETIITTGFNVSSKGIFIWIVLMTTFTQNFEFCLIVIM